MLIFTVTPTPSDIAARSRQSTAAKEHAAVDDFTVAKNFLQQHCLKCHSGGEPSGDLDLERFEDQVTAEADLETWELIIDSINDEYMPPPEEPRPSQTDIKQLKGWYQKTLLDLDAIQPSAPRMRRMNRIEYENTVGDLLRIDGEIFNSPSRLLLVDKYFNPASKQMPNHVLAMSHMSYKQKKPPLIKNLPEVPTDPPVEHGYSNDESALSFSPLQAERYFEIANAILNGDTFPTISGLWDSLFLPKPHETEVSQQKATAKRRLSKFLMRAFRRPVSSIEIDRYSALFDQQIDRTGSHIEAMKSTVAAIMVSPSFLFRRDFSADSYDERTVNSYAMANRLSYFLWASMPDDQLFQAASEDRLNTPNDLNREVRRMMEDKKIKSLATDFGMQWLKLAGVNSAKPDPDLFPEFYETKVYTIGTDMMIEQLLFFETIMIEDRDIMEFIDARWAYLNRNLLDWYGEPPQTILGYTPPREMWEDFFRIEWSNLHRGGVIAAGATLVSTSGTTRTSPVYRGAWILDVIFNRPPPAPPANVPALEEVHDSEHGSLNVRQRLEKHRLDANCAVCHDRIDPMGFALEKFDPIGRFRAAYPNGSGIDAGGEVFGESFVGAARFKAVIGRNQREFVQGFTEHMLKYALGRQLEFADENETQAIIDRVMKRGKRFSAVVEEIVASDLFRAPPHVLRKKLQETDTSNEPSPEKADGE